MSLKTLLTSGEYATNRVEAFSDGVFAIIVTLLILDIHAPDLSHPNNPQLLSALWHLIPKILIYVIGFLNIAVYWINHHQLFHVLHRTDRGFLWLNCMLLLVLAFMPFPTSVIGEYPTLVTSTTFFGGMMMITAFIFGTMRAYSTYYGCLIDCDRIDDMCAKWAVLKSYSGVLFYAVAVLSGYFSTKIAIALFFVIPLVYALPDHLEVGNK